jgi:hypothetical protein
MTAARGYFVDGVELVNVGGETCSACDRPAIGRSVSGHLICATHAGWAAREARELAREKKESAKRVAKNGIAPIHRAIARYNGVRQVETASNARRTQRGRDAAAKYNAQKSADAKAARESAVVAALQSVGTARSLPELVKLTGLSLSTVKRTVESLTIEKRLRVRGRYGSMSYSLREDGA